jgi:GNAT superfamily N-acetyltransferase
MSVISEIRLAVNDDISQVVASVTKLFAEDAGMNDPLVDVNWPGHCGFAHYSSLLSDPACLIMVADVGGSVVGHLVGKMGPPTATRPSTVAVLESLYVDQGHRRKGLGGDLIDAFLTWSREQGAVRAIVTSYAANEAAQQTYSHFRFEPQSVILTLTL